MVYGSVSERPERYYPALVALNQLVGGDGEVITAASVFGQGQYKSTAEGIEAYYRRLGGLLDSRAVLVVLPAADSRIGTNLWNTMVVAQQRWSAYA